MGILLRNRKAYSPGEVCCYTSRQKTYGLVFLCRQADYYLIALSEELSVPPKSVSVEDILRSRVYTVAWFSDIELLPKRRLHSVGSVTVSGDFHNRAGLYVDEHGGIMLKNVGQAFTWKHDFRAFGLKDVSVGDMLTTKYLPRTAH